MKLYMRSFVASLGLLFGGGMIALYFHEGDHRSSWPTWSWALWVALLLFGVVALFYSVYGRSKTVERWFENAMSTDASIIVAVLALPIYGLLKLLGVRDH
jgi:hypothetical protein